MTSVPVVSFADVLIFVPLLLVTGTHTNWLPADVASLALTSSMTTPPVTVVAESDAILKPAGTFTLFP